MIAKRINFKKMLGKQMIYKNLVKNLILCLTNKKKPPRFCKIRRFTLVMIYYLMYLVNRFNNSGLDFNCNN